MEHHHEWLLSYTGRINGVALAFYRCAVCKETKTVEEELQLNNRTWNGATGQYTK